MVYKKINTKIEVSEKPEIRKKILLQQLYNSTAHRKPREDLRDWVLSDKVLLDELIAVAFDTDNKFHFKACWVLELVFEQEVALIIPHLERFCNVISEYTHDSAIRPITKITYLVSKENYSENPQFHLSEKQITQITECCMDRLISDEKVAAKAYSAETLFILGKHQDWIYPELKQILSDGYTEHSPAYKATARKILRKL